jgi:hypothetical protein
VTTNGKITVTVWSEPPRSVVAEKRSQPRIGFSGAVGIAGTLLLHSLALQSMLLGSGSHQIKLPAFQTSGSARKQSQGQSAESLILIELPTITLNDNAPVRAAIKESPIRLSRPDLSLPPDVGMLVFDEDSKSRSSAPGKSGRVSNEFGAGHVHR